MQQAMDKVDILQQFVDIKRVSTVINSICC